MAFRSGLLNQNQKTNNEARILFFIDYIAIMILFAMIGCLITSKLSRLSSGNDKERKE